MPPPFCGISATRGYMGAIMLYIRGVSGCFPGNPPPVSGTVQPGQAALPPLLIYKEAPCTLEGFCPLTNCPSAHTERSPDPPTGRGSVIFAGNAPFSNTAAPAGLPTVFTLRIDPASYTSTKRILYFHIVSVFLWMHKNASYYSFSRHERLNLPNSPHIFCMEAHSSHSYSL